MKNLFLFITVFTYPIFAFAGNTECLDSSGNFYYHKYQQEGGPCCGRESTQLQYKKEVLKHTLVIYARHGKLDSEDSNPNLKIEETNFVDMQNSYQDDIYEYSAYAMNLNLISLDGSVILPDSNQKNIVVSVICTSTRFLIPPP